MEGGLLAGLSDYAWRCEEQL